MHEHRYSLADPARVVIKTGVQFPVFVELNRGSLVQVCVGMMTWFESLEHDAELWGSRLPDGGMVAFEVTGSTVDGVALLVTDAVPWSPGVFPSLAAGDRMELGPLLVSALARGTETPDRDYPAALSCLLDDPEAGEDDQ